jgi:hypothetical protein
VAESLLPSQAEGPVRDIALAPAAPSRLTALRIALWGGVGGGLGRVIWEAVFEKGGVVDWGLTEWAGFVLAVAAVTFWELRIKPHLKARLSGESPPPPAPPPASGVGTTLVAALQAVILVVIVAMTLQMVLGPLRRHPDAFIHGVLTLAVICGAITYVWVRWAHGPLVWALLASFVAGLVISHLVTIVDICLWPEGYRNPPLATWRYQLSIGINSLTWASWALVGSLAIHQKWGPCPSLGILAGTLLLDPIWVLIPWAVFGHAVLQRMTVALLFLGTFRTVGWALGLYICPGADRTLDLSPGAPRGTGLFWGLLAVSVLLYGVLLGLMFWLKAPAG